MPTVQQGVLASIATGWSSGRLGEIASGVASPGGQRSYQTPSNGRFHRLEEANPGDARRGRLSGVVTSTPSDCQAGLTAGVLV